VVTDVADAAGRGVNVGVGVAEGCLGVAVGGVNVGDGAGPSDRVNDWSTKPGPAVGVGDEEPLLPEQLRNIAPKTNNKTGAITSHLSHRDFNIES
jgi:hypothetical protein